ncbi:hypothetical protein AD02_5455 [Escherichia coli 2-460-02_S4_C2]|nr:hypothetical protein AD02_5455 [Escherichia coli 2-460-02_S4_C2]
MVINIVSDNDNDNVNGMHKCRYYNDTMDVIDNKATHRHDDIP